MIDITKFPLEDSKWTEKNWHDLLVYLKENNIVSYREMASSVLGLLNPPQVGTQVASKKGFQKHYGKGRTMQKVYKWLYEREGTCVDCGTRLELQADHIKPKQEFENPEDADYLTNLDLRCRRCNVIKRPSHKKGGLTFLPAASAMMWILLRKRPKNYMAFEKICREYGLTMANVRFHEGWAMAVWLNKLGKYEIEEE